jgi:Holliday junction resolvasome RuvABC endonuclease subunit
MSQYRANTEPTSQTITHGHSILGVDPGAVSGLALVSIDSNPYLLWSGQIPHNLSHEGALLKAIAAAIEADYPLYGIAIEDQFVGRNADSALKLAHSAGRWYECGIREGIVPQYVHPTTWQRAELGRVPFGQTKTAAIEKCAALWPRIGVLSEHVADAALIARFAAIDEWYRLQGKKTK